MGPPSNGSPVGGYPMYGVSYIIEQSYYVALRRTQCCEAALLSMQIEDLHACSVASTKLRIQVLPLRGNTI